MKTTSNWKTNIAGLVIALLSGYKAYTDYQKGTLDVGQTIAGVAAAGGLIAAKDAKTQ